MEVLEELLEELEFEDEEDGEDEDIEDEDLLEELELEDEDDKDEDEDFFEELELEEEEEEEEENDDDDVDEDEDEDDSEVEVEESESDSDSFFSSFFSFSSFAFFVFDSIPFKSGSIFPAAGGPGRSGNFKPPPPRAFPMDFAPGPMDFRTLDTPFKADFKLPLVLVVLWNSAPKMPPPLSSSLSSGGRTVSMDFFAFFHPSSSFGFFLASSQSFSAADTDLGYF